MPERDAFIEGWIRGFCATGEGHNGEYVGSATHREPGQQSPSLDSLHQWAEEAWAKRQRHE